MEPCLHNKVFSGKPNYRDPKPHNFEWICNKCQVAGYKDVIWDDDYVDQDLFDKLKPLAKHNMKSITAHEAFDRMFAGEVVFASIAKPLIEDSLRTPELREFKIVRGRYGDVVVYINAFDMRGWEQYHCAVNTFLKFDWYVKEEADHEASI